MSEPTCATCPYGVRTGNVSVQCRVTARYAKRLPSDWCASHPARQRDRIAARALQAILSARPSTSPVLAARAAYRAADALEAVRVGADEAPESAGEARCA